MKKFLEGLWQFFDNFMLENIFEPMVSWLQMKTKKTNFWIADIFAYLTVEIVFLFGVFTIVRNPTVYSIVDAFWFLWFSVILAGYCLYSLLLAFKYYEERAEEKRTSPKEFCSPFRKTTSAIIAIIVFWIIIFKISGETRIIDFMMILLLILVFSSIFGFIKSCTCKVKNEKAEKISDKQEVVA